MNPKSILSKKLTSENYQSSYYSGFFDKIILNAKPLSITKDQFKEHLRSLEIPSEDGSFRRGGMRIKFATSSGHKNYAKYIYSTGMISQFVLNPSPYQTYEEFSEDALSLLGLQASIEDLPITRLDKTIDLTLSLDEVLHSLITRFKRSAKAHSYSSGRLTGLQIGKSPETIKVYDRSLKAKLPFPCTRIETCCTGKKVGATSLKDLRNSWQSNPLHQDKTYQNLTFASIEFSQGSNSKRARKAGELEVLCRYFPYLLVKSCLNQNGNFLRDYGPVHNLVPWKAQPMAIFNTGVRNFFNSDEKQEE